MTENASSEQFDEAPKDDLPIWDYWCHGVDARHALNGIVETLKEFYAVGLDPDVVNVSIKRRLLDELEKASEHPLLWEGTLLIRGEKRWPDVLTAMWDKELEGAVDAEQPEV